MTGKPKRDDFTIAETPERRRVLEIILEDKLAKTTLTYAEEVAYRELAHDGLVHGKYITGRGHAAAVAWGLVK